MDHLNEYIPIMFLAMCGIVVLMAVNYWFWSEVSEIEMSQDDKLHYIHIRLQVLDMYVSDLTPLQLEIKKAAEQLLMSGILEPEVWFDFIQDFDNKGTHEHQVVTDDILCAAYDLCYQELNRFCQSIDYKRVDSVRLPRDYRRLS